VLEATLLPVCIVLFAGVLVLLHFQRQRADRFWQISHHDLKVDDPPEVLGKGGFGVVLAARFRGTRVAVKRAFIPDAKRSTRKSKINAQRRTALFGILGTAANSEATLTARRSRSASTKDGICWWGNQPNRIADAFETAEEGAEAQGTQSKTITGGLTMNSHSSSTAAGFLLRCFGSNRLEKARKLLIREMRILSRLQHPNICRMLGAVMDNREPLMVLEFLQMGSLHGILHNLAMSLDGDFVYGALRDIVAGMKFLHASDLIHGDLKAAVSGSKHRRG
jgi:serine/threonine protein kinase